jgi:hypothetical protein
MSQNDSNDWGRRLDSGERDDPLLALAARLQAGRSPAPRPSPNFKSDLRARLLAQSATQRPMRWATGLAFAALLVIVAVVGGVWWTTRGPSAVSPAKIVQHTPSAKEISTHGEDTPFEICGESSAWVRPPEEEQTRKWWNSGRYAGIGDEYLKRLWADDFFVAYGNASTEFDLENLSGLWTLPADVRAKCLEPQRQEAVLKLQVAEIWALFHRVINIKRLETNYVIVVEAAANGVQFVQFSRPSEHKPLTLHFVTQGGEELKDIVEAESLDWPYPSLVPTRQP